MSEKNTTPRNNRKTTKDGARDTSQNDQSRQIQAPKRKPLNRRDVIKGLLAGTVGVATAGLLGGAGRVLADAPTPLAEPGGIQPAFNPNRPSESPDRLSAIEISPIEFERMKKAHYVLSGLFIHPAFYEHLTDKGHRPEKGEGVYSALALALEWPEELEYQQENENTVVIRPRLHVEHIPDGFEMILKGSQLASVTPIINNIPQPKITWRSPIAPHWDVMEETLNSLNKKHWDKLFKEVVRAKKIAKEAPAMVQKAEEEVARRLVRTLQGNPEHNERIQAMNRKEKALFLQRLQARMKQAAKELAKARAKHALGQAREKTTQREDEAFLAFNATLPKQLRALWKIREKRNNNNTDIDDPLKNWNLQTFLTLINRQPDSPTAMFERYQNNINPMMDFYLRPAPGNSGIIEVVQINLSADSESPVTVLLAFSAVTGQIVTEDGTKKLAGFGKITEVPKYEIPAKSQSAFKRAFKPTVTIKE